MRKKTKNTLVALTIVTVLAVIIIMAMAPRPRRRTKKTVRWANPMRTIKFVDRTPEFRPPPEKAYKPSIFQQMGLLTGADGKILPLYGKESSAHRDRYNYYTTTPGNQVYSLPIAHNNKDCTDDIGCGEFYGNEDVSVTGMDGEFKAEIYRNKNIQLM
jgi:hypothetical protein